MRRAYALPADELTFTQCFPLPGSAVHKEWRKRYSLDKIDWAEYKVATSRHALSEIDSRQLQWLIRRARVGLKFRRRNRMLGKIWARFFV